MEKVCGSRDLYKAGLRAWPLADARLRLLAPDSDQARRDAPASIVVD